MSLLYTNGWTEYVLMSNVRLVVSNFREHTWNETDSKRKMSKFTSLIWILNPVLKAKVFYGHFCTLQEKHYADSGSIPVKLDMLYSFYRRNENKIDFIPNWQKCPFLYLTWKTPEFSDNLLFLETFVHCTFKIEILTLL